MLLVSVRVPTSTDKKCKTNTTRRRGEKPRDTRKQLIFIYFETEATDLPNNGPTSVLAHYYPAFHLSCTTRTSRFYVSVCVCDSFMVDLLRRRSFFSCKDITIGEPV